LNFGKNSNGWDFADPANIWNLDKGFLTQSTSPLFYNLNFPTTGADASLLSWSPVMHSGITATVRWIKPSSSDN
jgi:hypothetical protein